MESGRRSGGLMFNALGSRFEAVFGSLRREVRLTPDAVERALREIRLALLEADVNFRVVRAFTDRVRDRAIDRAVLDSLTPSQQVVAIVRDELLALFGEPRPGLASTGARPQVVLLVGLQGSGKTTTTAKLGTLAHEGAAPPAARLHRCAPSRGDRPARRAGREGGTARPRGGGE